VGPVAAAPEPAAAPAHQPSAHQLPTHQTPAYQTPAYEPPAHHPPAYQSPLGGESPAREQGRPQPKPVRRAETERGLRGLVGAGPSQVGVSGAMRARDAARPTAEDIEAAERDLIIVRRNYVPPDARPES
jgi:hypothetical protein